MQKPWIEHYPAGIPATIDPDAYDSINALFEGSFKKFAQRPAFTNMGTTLTYAEIDTYSKAFASYLLQGLGLKKGDSVAIMMPNILQYPICFFGILRAGLVVTNINPLYTARELKHQLNDSEAKAIIIVENFCSVLADVVKETRFSIF